MLKKRLFGNLAANVFAQFSTTVVQLASVPLFLAFWSKGRYGEWILLSAIPSYLALADAGFATFSANEVSMLVSKGDRASARKSLHTAWGFLVGISTLITLLSWAALWTIPWVGFLRISLIEPMDAQVAATILCLYAVAGLFLGIYGTVYRGAFRNARNVYLTNAGRLVELGGLAACVSHSQSVVVLATTMLGARLLTLLALDMDSRRFSADLHLGISAFSIAELKRTWKPATMFMAFSLGNALYFQGLTLLVGKILGPVNVVIFNTTRTYTRVIVQFVTMIKHSVWPEFSYLYGAGDLDRARRLNALAFEATWVTALALACSLFLAGPRLISAWTHSAVQVNSMLLLLLIAGAALNSVWFVCSGLLMGANRHYGLSVLYLSATGLTLILAVPLIHWLRISGAAWAMIICESTILPYALLQTCALLRQPLKAFLLDAFCLKRTSATIVPYIKMLAKRLPY